MRFYERITEEDWDDLSQIENSIGWKALKKVVSLWVHNAQVAALTAGTRKITTKSQSSEIAVEQSIPEQLSSLRGEVFGYKRLIKAIDEADKEKEKLKKRREEREKKEKASKKNIKTVDTKSI